MAKSGHKNKKAGKAKCPSPTVSKESVALAKNQMSFLAEERLDDATVASMDVDGLLEDNRRLRQKFNRVMRILKKQRENLHVANVERDRYKTKVNQALQCQMDQIDRPMETPPEQTQADFGNQEDKREDPEEHRIEPLDDRNDQETEEEDDEWLVTVQLECQDAAARTNVLEEEFGERLLRWTPAIGSA